MDSIIQGLVDDIDAKVATLLAAKAALLSGPGATNGTSKQPPILPPALTTVLPAKPAPTASRKTMSEEAKKRIGESAKKRWAERRKLATTAAKSASKK